jgi:hypothetical protein
MNGNEVALRAKKGLSGNPNYNLTIGKRCEWDALFYKGFMDEVRVYNTALDSATIKCLYNRYKPKY